MNTDIVIVGAGPAGIFTAIEMIRRGSKKHITIVEKGQPIEKRRCPKTVTKSTAARIATSPPAFPARARFPMASSPSLTRSAAISRRSSARRTRRI